MPQTHTSPRIEARRFVCGGCGRELPDDPHALELWVLTPHYVDGALCLGEVMELTDDSTVPRIMTPAGFARWDRSTAVDGL